MGAIDGAVLGMALALVILGCWKAFGGRTDSKPAPDPRPGTSWKTRSVALKSAGGAAVALLCFAIGTFGQGGDGPARQWDPRMLAVSAAFAAAMGGLIGFCLSLRDVVRERELRRERIHWILRAYFTFGLASLLLWCVTFLFVGFAGIIGLAVVNGLLNSQVGPAVR